MFAFTKWTIIKNSLPFFFSHSPTFYVFSFVLWLLYVMHSLFLIHHFIFRHRLYQLPPLCRCTLCTISLFSHIYFFKDQYVGILHTHSLSISTMHAEQGIKQQQHQKKQKTFIFFPGTYTMVHMCVFSMNLYNLLR